MAADHFRSWLTKVGWEVAFATAIAAAFVITAGGNFAQFFRYLSGLSGIFSLTSMVLVLARKQLWTTRLSD